MNTRNRTTSAALAALLLLGCSKGVEPGAPVNQPAAPHAGIPAPTATTGGAPAMGGSPSAPSLSPAAPPSVEATSMTFHGLRAPKPEAWTSVEIENAVQSLRLEVPSPTSAPAGGEPAYLVTFYLGGTGGGVQPNINRWAGQFTSADGGPVEPTVTTHQAGGFNITLVELRGTYLGMGTGAPAPNQLFLSAIVEASGGTVFIRLVGPTATVEANREAYMALLNGLGPA
jgi:hypothetical protein